ncbi:hypothetical protein BS78_03G336300 [Paspalum vaginatum]|nr:hypothetical protein BS78_03G336300 [Paspalum vaginatum]
MRIGRFSAVRNTANDVVTSCHPSTMARVLHRVTIEAPQIARVARGLGFGSAEVQIPALSDDDFDWLMIGEGDVNGNKALLHLGDGDGIEKDCHDDNVRLNGDEAVPLLPGDGDGDGNGIEKDCNDDSVRLAGDEAVQLLPGDGDGDGDGNGNKALLHLGGGDCDGKDSARLDAQAVPEAEGHADEDEEVPPLPGDSDGDGNGNKALHPRDGVGEDDSAPHGGEWVEFKEATVLDILRRKIRHLRAAISEAKCSPFMID